MVPTRIIRADLFQTISLISLKQKQCLPSANHSFDYLYVDDLISAMSSILLIIRDIPAYNTYNVCSGHSDSFYSILCDVISSLGGSSSSIHMDSLTPTEFRLLW